MRHRRATTKLGRKTEHRQSLIANQVCSLILHERIRTTLAKAKAVRPFAEKMVTLGKYGTIHDRRNALAFLKQKEAVKKLFSDIAARCASRNGGYTRIVKLGQRFSDAAPMAYLEWVDGPVAAEAEKPAAEQAEAAEKPKARGGRKKAAASKEGAAEAPAAAEASAKES